MAEEVLKFADRCKVFSGEFFVRTGCLIITLPYINILLSRVCSSSRTTASEVPMLLHRFVYGITGLLTNLDTAF
jgi:hypothetical protein